MTTKCSERYPPKLCAVFGLLFVVVAVLASILLSIRRRAQRTYLVAEAPAFQRYVHAGEPHEEGGAATDSEQGLSFAGSNLMDMRNATVAECSWETKVVPGGRVSMNGKYLPPTLFYLGWGHAGSATLGHVLRETRKVSFGILKEHRYLCSGHAWNSRRHSLAAYIEQFWVPCEVEIAMDLSPVSYAALLPPRDPMWPHLQRCSNDKQSPLDRVREMVAGLPKELRFFAMLRDPLDWHFSQFGNHTIKAVRGSERVLTGLVKQGCYASVLERWFKEFPEVPLRIFASEDMFKDPMNFFADIFAWIGVPNHPRSYYEANFLSGRRRSQKVLTMDDYRKYHSHPEAVRCKAWLERLAGRNFSWKGAS
mmetsp:Transcript_21242/g.38765  ORF Transcript_21242/g.38765 Transcript_21242/m.38765 type:complete len:365 (+) Transcript_21242:115-1209(+)